MKNHKTKSVPIKTVNIDAGIIPVVRWLNSFNDIITRWSCEGDAGKKSYNKPYIIFYNLSNNGTSNDLYAILTAISEYATVEVDFYEGVLRYRLVFHDKEFMTEFKKNITY